LAWHSFPEADPAWLAVDTVEVPVQVNGKLRSVIVAPVDADAATLEELARADQKVDAALAGRETKRVVAVPGRLINFVV
jgi:leucyl-tRNA synthetase